MIGFRMSARRRARIWVVSFIVSVMLLGGLLSQLDIGLFNATIQHIRTDMAIIAVCCAFLSNLAMSWRLGVLMRNRTMHSFWHRLNVTLFHETYLAVLPARLGEIAYIIMLQKRFSIPVGAAIANLAFQRLCDLLIVICLLAIGLAILAAEGHVAGYYVLPCIIIIICLIITIHKTDRVASVFAMGIMRILGRRKRWQRRLLSTLFSIRGWYMHRLSYSEYFEVVLATLVGWLCTLGVIYFCLRAIQINLNIGEILSIGSAYNLISAIPIQTIGGFGANEAGLASLFMLFGWSYVLAISMSLTTRLLLLVIPFVQVGLWWPAFQLLHRQK